MPPDDLMPLCPDEEAVIRKIRSLRKERRSKLSLELEHGRVRRLTRITTEEIEPRKKRRLREPYP